MQDKTSLSEGGVHPASASGCVDVVSCDFIQVGSLGVGVGPYPALLCFCFFTASVWLFLPCGTVAGFLFLRSALARVRTGAWRVVPKGVQGREGGGTHIRLDFWLSYSLRQVWDLQRVVGLGL